jgi:fibro-slime domain-containing protein
VGGYIHSPTSFSQWYHDAAGVNATYTGNIVLWQQASGSTTYANRYGSDGQQWPMTSNITYCSSPPAGCDDPACVTQVGMGQTCFAPCTPWGPSFTQACTALVTLLDGNPLFFPLDTQTGLVTPSASFKPAQIPDPIYGGMWAAEPGGAKHNFDFTTEMRFWLKYDATATATVLDFIGDDDAWVFINGMLAVDLGGWHIPLEGSLTLNATNAGKFGLQDGKLYEVALFQTERQVSGSSFKLSVSNAVGTRSQCAKP